MCSQPLWSSLHLLDLASPHLVQLFNGQRGYKLRPDTCNFSELFEIVVKWREAHRCTQRVHSCRRFHRPHIEVHLFGSPKLNGLTAIALRTILPQGYSVKEHRKVIFFNEFLTCHLLHEGQVLHLLINRGMVNHYPNSLVGLLRKSFWHTAL